MSGTTPLDLAELRSWAENDQRKPASDQVTLGMLWLIDAVEAAQALTTRHFGQLEAREFYRLRELLARFTGGEAATIASRERP